MGNTGYYTHRDFWKHEMGRGHPECPERLDAIEDRLFATGVADALERHDDDIPLATLAQITRAHSAEHMERLEALAQRLVADAPAGGPDHAPVDPDTSLCRGTLLAARRAAGLASTEAEVALHDLGTTVRRFHVSSEDRASIAALRRLAGDAAIAWHRRLAAAKAPPEESC